MAEPAGFDPRRIFLVGGVIAVILFSVLFFLFRSCAPEAGRKSGYTLVYSNLELKDAANVIARLKELTIPYEIRDDGRAIAVPKEKADQARLGLAEKNLPAGGIVGWEIFDTSKLGATDFDRRIQLIRAISGELSRTIRRIQGVEDVRVQVVIPETKLFAATTSPVTASVMLRIHPGLAISGDKINGIIHLVASSVENLQPENVTVIDEFGRILSARAAAQPREIIPAPVPGEKPVVLAPTEEIVVKSAPVITPEASPEVKATVLTTEEIVMLKVAAKKELESDLSSKAQELLNRFYPINSVIVKVEAAVFPARHKEIRAKDLKIKKLNAIILVDNRVDFTANLKKVTFTTVAAAIGYNKKRGDAIILQRVPFHLAVPPPPVEPKQEMPKAAWWIAMVFSRNFWYFGLAVVIVMAAVWAINAIRFRPYSAPQAIGRPAPAASPPPPPREGSKLDKVRSLADQHPERIAELFKQWLGE